MRRLKTFAVVLAAAMALGGCAQFAAKPTNGLSYSEAQTRYQHGLSSYRENQFEPALADLTAALGSGQLRNSDALNARKHIAFIQCSSGREAQCREQFQAILQADPKFDLAPNEAGHPLWGPVWRSLKGTVEEQRAVTQASSSRASPAQQKLAEGIKEYDDGRYKEAIATLQAALKGGLAVRNDEIRARKYAAFANCLTKQSKQCRNEFRQIFTLDPAFELSPSEVGHPAWKAIYRSEKAAAAKRAAPAKK